MVVRFSRALVASSPPAEAPMPTTKKFWGLRTPESAAWGPSTGEIAASDAGESSFGMFPDDIGAARSLGSCRDLAARNRTSAVWWYLDYIGLRWPWVNA